MACKFEEVTSVQFRIQCFVFFRENFYATYKAPLYFREFYFKFYIFIFIN